MPSSFVASPPPLTSHSTNGVGSAWDVPPLSHSAGLATVVGQGTARVDRILAAAAPGTYHRLEPGETYDYGTRH